MEWQIRFCWCVFFISNMIRRLDGEQSDEHNCFWCCFLQCAIQIIIIVIICFFSDGISRPLFVYCDGITREWEWEKEKWRRIKQQQQQNDCHYQYANTAGIYRFGLYSSIFCFEQTFSYILQEACRLSSQNDDDGFSVCALCVQKLRGKEHCMKSVTSAGSRLAKSSTGFVRTFLHY